MGGEAKDRKVFSEDFVAGMRHRYEQKKSHDRPTLFRIATTDDLQDRRDEIELWVAELRPRARRAFLRRLRHPDQWLAARNELAVAAQLRSLGYHLDYEKKLQVLHQGKGEPLTPDWYVQGKGDMPPFLVEVATIDWPLDTQGDDLKRRLEQILVDACLFVDPRQAEGGLSQQRNKRIARCVRLWLTNDNPAAGEWACFEGVRCKLEDWGLGCPTLHCEILADPWVDMRPLREKIEKKIDRYKRLATEMQLPLAIAVVPNESTPYDFGTFDWALFGSVGLQVFRDASGGFTDQQVVRDKQGLLRRVNPAFSAGIMVLRKPQGQWEMKAIHNPDAANPLPADTFAQSR